MTKRERVLIRAAYEAFRKDEGEPGGWEHGMELLARLLGMRVRRITTRGVPLLSLIAGRKL